MESHTWVQTDKHDLVPCKWNFAALKNAKLNKHYRARLNEDRLAHRATTASRRTKNLLSRRGCGRRRVGQ